MTKKVVSTTAARILEIRVAAPTTNPATLPGKAQEPDSADDRAYLFISLSVLHTCVS